MIRLLRGGSGRTCFPARRFVVLVWIAGCVAIPGLGVSSALAQSLLPATPVALDSLAGFHGAGANWHLAGALGGDPRRDRSLVPLSGTGLIVDVPGDSTSTPLTTTWDHGDLECDFDFLLSPGAQPLLWLQGRYAVPLAMSAAGGGRAPGLWQHAHVEFRAPRFGANGAKVSDARFAKIEINGFAAQHDEDLTGPTRGSPLAGEQARGPIVFAGDRGSFALRALAVKQSGEAQVRVENLTLAFFAGMHRGIADYADKMPARETAASRFNGVVLEADGRGAAVFTGSFVVSAAGDYGFAADTGSAVRLLVDGRLVIAPNELAARSGTVELAAGSHPFRLDVVRASARELARFAVHVEGPGIAARELLPPAHDAGTERLSRAILVTPKDRVLTQRTFVTMPTERRIYAVAVGSPAGVNFAYDFVDAAILRVWRGGFIDGAGLWNDRGYDQEAAPLGPTLTLRYAPLLALFGDNTSHWPAQPMEMARSHGYHLAADGQPVFLYECAGVSATDRIVPAGDGSGLTRTMTFSGRPWERSMWALIAEGSTITPQPGGGGFVVGDREYYVDWPSTNSIAPQMRSEAGRVQVIAPLPNNADAEITYTLAW